MDALGWQICGVLVGSSFLIMAVYLAKTLSNANKIVERVYKLLDHNEKNLENILENVSSISDSVDIILSGMFKFTTVLGLLRRRRRKRR